MTPIDRSRMDADDIIEAQGWSDAELVLLYRAYIDNQASPEALADFLADRADEENA